jgi:hypothetical protein
MTDELPDMPAPREWLNPNVVDYHGQHSPPEWHDALVAVLKLRPPDPTGPSYRQWRTALHEVHDTIARELGIEQ